MKNNQSDESIRKSRFEHIYALYGGRIYNFALRISHGNAYMAEELTQTVFMKLWERFDTLAEVATLEAYLFQIARNTFINNLKRETLEYIYHDYLQSHHTEATDADAVEDAIDAATVNRCVATLVDEMPPVRREVFRRSRIDGKANKQIAAEMGIAESTVETHLSLALKFIRHELRWRFGIMCTILLALVQ